jgi:hypothetical protein
MNQEIFWEQSQSWDGAGFFTGLVAGTLIGAGLGVLFAPRRGVELRGHVANSAASVGQSISKTVDGWAERSRVAYEGGRDAAARARDEFNRVAATRQNRETHLNTPSDPGVERGPRPTTFAAEHDAEPEPNGSTS